MSEATAQPPVAQAKVVTDHAEAQHAIESLRSIAIMLKAVGDENVELESRCDTLQDRLEESATSAREAQDAWTAVTAVKEMVADFDRGLLDKDELVREVNEIGGERGD